MNCKIKALIVGVSWGVSLLLALAAVIAILSGLFMLGDSIGVNIAGIVSVAGFAGMFVIAAKAGYEYYLERCNNANP